MSDKKLKAFEVRDNDEGNCVIAFATNGAAARREGGNDLNLEFEDVESCRRAPWADEYAPGPVPLHAYLADMQDGALGRAARPKGPPVRRH